VVLDDLELRLVVVNSNELVAVHLSWNDCNNDVECCFIFANNGIASSLSDTLACHHIITSHHIIVSTHTMASITIMNALSNNGKLSVFQYGFRESSNDTFSRNRARASPNSPLYHTYKMTR
jgi:hypothetical protein